MRIPAVPREGLAAGRLKPRQRLHEVRLRGLQPSAWPQHRSARWARARLGPASPSFVRSLPQPPV